MIILRMVFSVLGRHEAGRRRRLVRFCQLQKVLLSVGANLHGRARLYEARDAFPVLSVLFELLQENVVLQARPPSRIIFMLGLFFFSFFGMSGRRAVRRSYRFSTDLHFRVRRRGSRSRSRCRRDRNQRRRRRCCRGRRRRYVHRRRDSCRCRRPR